MRLDKMRGWGPWFAFGVPFLFLLSVFGVVAVNALVPGGTDQPPAWFIVAIILWVLCWAVMIVGGLVVAIDLEWIEHPRTNTSLTYVGLGAMAVATVAFILFLIDGLGLLPPSLAVQQVTSFAVFAGFGVYLVVMNLVGMRAGLLGRILPWIGIVSGVLFLFGALMAAVNYDNAGLGYVPAWAIYLAWSFWLGFRLRGRAPEAATAPA